MSEELLRIGIDCRLAGKRHAGIGRYIQNLIELAPKTEKKLGLHIQWIYFFSDLEQKNEFALDKDVEVIYVPYRHYSVAEQVSLPSIFSKAKLDVLHVPHFNIPLFYKGKTVITIHDLLWHEYKGADVTTLSWWMYLLKYQAYLFTVGQAVQKAKLIFVPTQTVKDTVSKYYPTAKKKIEVTREGISSAFVSAGKKSDQPTKKQFVYVGSLYPHKNVKVIIESLKKLPEYTLKLVGTRSIFQEQTKAEIKKNGVEHQVEFAGYLSDEELITLLQQSTALVQPSLSEGFGLTGVEAMATGTPVIASDIPIFHEVYQDGAVYFHPHSVESFISAVKEVEDQDPQQLKKIQQATVAKYDWKKMAEETVSAYGRIASQ